jgi:hypothetical protein
MCGDARPGPGVCGVAGAGGIAAAPTSPDRLVAAEDVSVFFRDTTAWGGPDAPRPLLGACDLHKSSKRIPRFIPADQLARLMMESRPVGFP